MDLRLTQEQEMLRDAVRSMCERHSSIETVRALESDEKGYSDDLWNALTEMGVLALLVDDWLPIEVSVVCEELGRALCPSPYIETAVFGATALGKADEVVTLAWHEAERSDGLDGISLRASNGKLTGEKILVPFASSASSLMTLARDDAGVSIYLVAPSDTTLEWENTLASDARFKVRYDGAPGERVGSSFMEALVPSWIAVAAYAVGAAQRAHELSVEYAKERVQFDKPIGTFQAMAHPLADLATEIGGARTMVHQAAWALAQRRDAHAAAAMAKYYACDVFRRTAKFGHQVFGGIGFTLDIDIQLFMRRAKQLEVLWMGPRALEEIIAGAELDAEAPFVTADAVSSVAGEPPA